MSLSRHWSALSLSLSWVLVAGCADCGSGGRAQEGGAPTLTLGAYSTPREAYALIVPAFRAAHRERTGRDVEVRTSFMASGAQARAIEAGFEADVAALSLEPDITLLARAGLVEQDLSEAPYGGMVTRSIVVIGVREGNPKGIRGFEDLAAEGVEVLTPNVRMSGGAMWNVLALVGAAARSHGAGEEEIVEHLAAVLRNVRIMDRGARDSLLTFERGVGDAIITYENELIVGRARGQKYEIVTPRATLLIENPAAVVEAHARRHGALEDARAFVDYLRGDEAQRTFAEHGLRPVSPRVIEETKGRFPEVHDLFTVADLGGFPHVREHVFGDRGLYARALGASKARPTSGTQR